MLEGWYCRSIANMQAEKEKGPSQPPKPETESSESSQSEPEPPINYRVQYKTLNKKLKCLVYENEAFQNRLRTSQDELINLCKDRNYILDRLSLHEKVEGSTTDTDGTESSEDVDVVKTDSKRRKSDIFAVPAKVPPLVLSRITSTPSTSTRTHTSTRHSSTSSSRSHMSGFSSVRKSQASPSSTSRGPTTSSSSTKVQPSTLTRAQTSSSSRTMMSSIGLRAQQSSYLSPISTTRAQTSTRGSSSSTSARSNPSSTSTRSRSSTSTSTRSYHSSSSSKAQLSTSGYAATSGYGKVPAIGNFPRTQPSTSGFGKMQSSPTPSTSSYSDYMGYSGFSSFLEPSTSGMKGQNVVKRRRPPPKTKPTCTVTSFSQLSMLKTEEPPPPIDQTLTTSDGHMTPEEVERHLQSRQSYLELVPERAPPTVPTEMFSNDPSADDDD